MLIANRLDQTTRLARIEDTARALRAAGARVDVEVFDDVRGHSVFFRSSVSLSPYLKEIEAP